MEISKATQSNQNINLHKVKEKSHQDKVEKKEEYIPSQGEAKKISYEKPVKKADEATIEKLKAESDRTYNQLRQIVEQLLARQGMTFQDVDFSREIKVDDQARGEAQALLDEGGPLSPEKVSDNIVSFAKAISGGDKGKIELLLGAIEGGFQAAAKALGGILPDISQKTYDLVKEKMNQWMDQG